MPLNPDLYDADYYLHGKETGKSLYSDYRWLPALTVPMVAAIREHLKIQPGDTLCDFGCARGYVVRAFRMLGYDARGVDLSPWAIQNADPEVRDFVTEGEAPPGEFDWVLAKDVLEHVPAGRLPDTLISLFLAARKGVFVVVPLSVAAGEPYVVPEYEQDVTHCIRLPLAHWSAMLCAAASEAAPGQWEVRASYRVPGVKDNWSHYPQGNGFLTARKGGF